MIKSFLKEKKGADEGFLKAPETVFDIEQVASWNFIKHTLDSLTSIMCALMSH